MKKNKAAKGSERALYMIVKLVCRFCIDKLVPFSGFKKKYTKAFVQGVLDELAVVEKMPRYDWLIAMQRIKHSALVKLNRDMCRRFQLLMRYVEEGFSESEWDAMRELAGGKLYATAANENWEDSKTMQEMASAFMAEHAEVLTEDGHMPEAFATDFGVQQAAYLAAMVQFETGKETTAEQTAMKMEANNALYKRARGIMKDGWQIFTEQPAVQKEFSYAALLKKVGRQGVTGFRMELVEEKTLLPVAGAVVRFLPTGKVFEGNANGIVMVELSKGTYRFVLTVPGYEDVKGELAAHTGVRHRVYLELKKAVMVAVKEEVADAV